MLSSELGEGVAEAFALLLIGSGEARRGGLQGGRGILTAYSQDGRRVVAGRSQLVAG